MKKPIVSVLVAVVVSVVVMSVMLKRARGSGAEDGAVANPALTVTATRLERSSFPVRIWATGNVAPWEEASIGAEVEGLRLVKVKVNVGDEVKRG